MGFNLRFLFYDQHGWGSMVVRISTAVHELYDFWGVLYCVVSIGCFGAQRC